jgi:DoxX-like family
MNILLWVLQILLAVWNMIGGVYVAMNYDKIANAWALSAFPKPAWMAFGVLQALFALGLVLPGAVRVLPKLPPIAAACLTVQTLWGIALYVQYAGFPGILWALVPGLLAAFVAYGRWPTRSSA